MGPGVPQPTLGAESPTDVAQCLQLLAEPKAWPPASGSIRQQPKKLTSSVPNPQRLEIQKPAPATITCACLRGLKYLFTAYYIQSQWVNIVILCPYRDCMLVREV